MLHILVNESCHLGFGIRAVHFAKLIAFILLAHFAGLFRIVGSASTARA